MAFDLSTAQDIEEEEKPRFDLASASDVEEPGLMDRAASFVDGVINPPSEDYPELPALYQPGGEAELNLYRQKDPTAQAGKDQYGNLVFTGDKGTFYPDKPGFSWRDIPQALSGTTDFLMAAAPALAAGTVAAPVSFLRGGGALLQGGTGFLSGSTRELAQTGDPMEALKAGLIEGTVDVAGEGLGRGIARTVAPFLSRGQEATEMVTPKGELTQDAMSLLERAEAPPQAGFDSVLDSELRSLPRGSRLSGEEAERANLFAQYGIEPTRAQVTRKATDFQNQQEAFKRSGEVRDALEAQDVAISRQFDEALPRSSTTTGDAFSFVTDKVEEADSAISAAYKAAREAAPDDKVVSVGGLAETVRRSHGEDALSGGVYSAVKARLQDMGLVDDKWRPTGRISVTQAEDLRKYLNQLHSSSPDGRRLIRQFKDSLDNDVARVSPDLFAEPRRMKSALESSLERASVSRRDKRRGGILKDIVENRANPERAIEYLKRDSVRSGDLDEMKTWLTRSGGEAQWEGIRRDVLDDIIGTAFRGPAGEMGAQATSRASLERAMKPWRGKLDVLFTESERGFLDDMAKLLSYREPVAGTALGKGPSSQGMLAAADRLVSKLPSVSLASEMLQKMASMAEDTRLSREVLENLARSTGRNLSNAEARALKHQLLALVRPVGGVGAGTATGVLESQGAESPLLSIIREDEERRQRYRNARAPLP